MNEVTPQPTFAEAKGSEANQHAKKLAKAKSSKKNRQYPKYYSQAGTKIVSVCVKPNGVYKEYIGNLAKKKEVAALKLEISKWTKEGIWINEHELKDFTSKKLKEFSK